MNKRTLEEKQYIEEKTKGLIIHMRLLNGKIVDLDNLQDEDIAIEQIAHSLSLQCRYNGQISEFYSIAQHSMLVAQFLEERYSDSDISLCGLLHDAAEAYIGDLVTPIKNHVKVFVDLEENILERILKKYNVYSIYKINEPYIHKVDRELYYAEVQYFFEGATKIIDELPYNNREDLTMAFLEDFEYYRSK